MCTKKLEKDPKHQKALLLRSSSYVKKQDFERALKDIEYLIILDRHNSAAYYLMGCIYEKMNKVTNNIITNNSF